MNRAARLRVIVAEDNEDMRIALIFILRDEFEVIAAVADGGLLIDAAIDLHPDVIVSDIFMPRLTGPQAMQELRARGRHFPFVFVSASVDSLGNCICSSPVLSKLNVADELVDAVYAARRRTGLAKDEGSSER